MRSGFDMLKHVSKVKGFFEGRVSLNLFAIEE